MSKVKCKIPFQEGGEDPMKITVRIEVARSHDIYLLNVELKITFSGSKRKTTVWQMRSQDMTTEKTKK